MVEKSVVKSLKNTTITRAMSSEVNEFFFSTKIEADPVMDTEIELNSSIDPPELTPHELYFDESLQTNEIITPDMNNSLDEDMIKIKNEWLETEQEDADNTDDETIATFVTSAGQQLALYAVEDTEDVFAVAVYDETGRPPSNFQFLTKEDVERLIGEGAVRTVKKPIQIKKQTYHGNVAITKQQSVSPVKPKVEVSQPKIAYETIEQSSNMSIDMPEETELHLVDKNTEFQDELTYEDILESPYMFVNTNTIQTNISAPVKKLTDDVERSTVQYILLDDQSDTELTFDDIEKSLKTFGKPSMLKSNVNSVPEASPMSPETEQFYLSPPMSPENSYNLDEYETSIKPARKILQNTVLKQKHVPNALLSRKELSNDTFIIEESTVFTSTVNDSEQISQQLKDSPDSNSKIKRPRKQQLITVNRADSEIIIQPASLVSEEEEEVPKKRGRRKKKRNENIRGRKGKTTFLPKKRIPVSQRIRIEIIDIDIENEENNDGTNGKKIEEITIDDGKEKCSSDKENEVIMVGDSDDDIEDVEEITNKLPSPIFKCDYCSKHFRQKRFLDMHLRDCPKSTSDKQLDSKLQRENSTKSTDSVTAVKKEYLCKHCEAKFDVVVALARHYRQHNMKKNKKNKMNNNRERKDDDDDDEDDDDDDDEDEDDTEIDSDEDESYEISSTRKTAEKRSVNSKIIKTRRVVRTYKSLQDKKTHCMHCGRWFSSIALLSNHYRQHSTLKSEKSIRRCRICREIFRSRLNYIRHMRMHSKIREQHKKRLQRTTRQSASKIITRKRGRPRKL